VCGGDEKLYKVLVGCKKIKSIDEGIVIIIIIIR